MLSRPVVGMLKPVGFVNDFAEVLSSEYESQLEAKLSDYSNKTGFEISVVIVRNLEGEVIENYVAELFELWGVGEKGKDNGVMFLVAIEDRQMRIETGYGVEGKLNDAKAGRIIREVVSIKFKEGKYEEGIGEGVESIIVELDKDMDDGSEEQAVIEERVSSGITGIIIFLAMLTYLGAFLARSKSWWLGGLVGAVTGMFVGVWAMIVFGLLGLLLDFVLSSNFNNLSKTKQSTGFWKSGGGFKTGGGGFGGFGGGRSGGGGASGSW